MFVRPKCKAWWLSGYYRCSKGVNESAQASEEREREGEREKRGERRKLGVVDWSGECGGASSYAEVQGPKRGVFPFAADL